MEEAGFRVLTSSVPTLVCNLISRFCSFLQFPLFQAVSGPPGRCSLIWKATFVQLGFRHLGMTSAEGFGKRRLHCFLSFFLFFNTWTLTDSNKKKHLHVPGGKKLLMTPNTGRTQFWWEQSDAGKLVPVPAGTCGTVPIFDSFGGCCKGEPSSD